MTLKEWIRQNKTTAVAFARRLGVRHSTIYRYMDGERTPGLIRAEKITKLTGGKVASGDLARVARGRRRPKTGHPIDRIPKPAA